MTTKKQTVANQANAKHSSGPKSIEGKQKVSSNRITHGILSTKLLLDGESPEDYQSLLDNLQNQLRPAGTLELALVERIAVSLWRQRRLVSAETASIALGITPDAIADTVGAGMGLSKYGDNSIRAKDLDPPDTDQMDWSRKVIAESEGTAAFTLGQLQKKAPLIFKQLQEDAAAERSSPGEYLEDVELEEFISDLVVWCEKELEKEDQHKQITRLVPVAVDKLNTPLGKMALFSKYQASLDNQTYKMLSKKSSDFVELFTIPL